MPKVYVGSSGILVKVDTGMDLSSVDEAKLLVRKPDGSVVEWGPVSTHGSEVYYLIQPGDLDLAGYYSVQAYVVVGGKVLYGEDDGFYVYEKFE